MLSLGWAKSRQVEPMLVDLVLKGRSVEAISMSLIVEMPAAQLNRIDFDMSATPHPTFSGNTML